SPRFWLMWNLPTRPVSTFFLPHREPTGAQISVTIRFMCYQVSRTIRLDSSSRFPHSSTAISYRWVAVGVKTEAGVVVAEEQNLTPPLRSAITSQTTYRGLQASEPRS